MNNLSCPLTPSSLSFVTAAGGGTGPSDLTKAAKLAALGVEDRGGVGLALEDYLDLVPPLDLSSTPPTEKAISTQKKERRRSLAGQRSDKSGLKEATERDRLDSRAKSKILALSDARLRANRAKGAYEGVGISLKDRGSNDQGNDVAIAELLEEWAKSESNLGRAYSQAVKYLGRTRQADTAPRTDDLLQEWVKRVGAPSTAFPLEKDGETGAATSTKEKVRIMSDMLPGGMVPPSSLPNLSDAVLPPPKRKDFHNVLHAWASSKVRRKGVHAEALLLRMTELNWWYPDVFDTAPDSKAFALVAKSFAGSTHSQALKKIIHLHTIHNLYADRGIAGVTRHDPFFLIHSLKALKNYRKPDEAKLADKWLGQLHSFVMDRANDGYVHGAAEAGAHVDDEVCVGSAVKVDLTGTYTTVIREYSKLRGTEGAAAKARDTLEKMHEVWDRLMTRIEDGAYSSDGGDGKGERATIATIDIKVNAYNLVLGSYKDSKSEKYAIEAIALLDRMMDAWGQAENGGAASATGVPFPTEQSFQFCIQSLSSFKDAEVAYEESQRLLSGLEKICADHGASKCHGVLSSKVYNSILELYIDVLAKRPNLLTEADAIIRRMEEMAFTHPETEPNATTWSHMLKAYSLASGEDEEKMDALNRAKKTFKLLEDMGSTKEDDISPEMTDKSYFHMMKCVANLVEDRREKMEMITKLFTDACEKGLVSANVLKMFRNHVTEKTFVQKAGDGRLADKWISNVSGNKVLYTDGSVGGAGKNARRKGKSTSNWKKNHRKREEEIRNRNDARDLKKRLKKMKGNSLKTRKQFAD